MYFDIIKDVFVKGIVSISLLDLDQ